ncbi:photosystem II assembly protein Psb34 [Nodosilinea sp. AN01ver1]|uniref:photosystem II assembly protein Psb34 n=1 Tax=Nodosilinea sp. AN01ver1 TaxID=3423362 RepID=UPI003D319BD2
MFTTTQLDNGILNNYAVEPDMYLAAHPSPEQQQRYATQAAFASIFVVALLLVSLAVS